MSSRMYWKQVPLLSIVGMMIVFQILQRIPWLGASTLLVGEVFFWLLATSGFAWVLARVLVRLPFSQGQSRRFWRCYALLLGGMTLTAMMTALLYSAALLGLDVGDLGIWPDSLRGLSILLNLAFTLVTLFSHRRDRIALKGETHAAEDQSDSDRPLP